VRIQADDTKLEMTEAELTRVGKNLHDFKAALDEHAIVAITDPKGKITYVNDKFCSISQYSEYELLGQDHQILNSGFHPREFFQNLWSTIRAGEVWRGEIRNRRKDGVFYWVDTTIVPFVGEEGEIEQYIAIRADITEQKMLENEVVEAAEHERMRIGQDLHDDLCQQLAALKLKCETTVRILKAEGNDQAGPLGEVAREISEATALSRTIAKGLSPVTLEVDGLMVALEQLAGLVEGRFRIQTQFHCPQPVEVASPSCASHAFRIAQELMYNAAKHAKPSKIQLSLYPYEQGFRIEVTNDGVPFQAPVAAQKRGGGMGLHLLKLRAGAIGASLEFFPGAEPDGGTLAVCRVPHITSTED